MNSRRARATHAAVLLLACALRAPAAELVDPTRPPDSVSAAKAAAARPKESIDYQLSAVKFSADSRWAIINGERVATGAQIGPARVLDIQAGQVVLDDQGERLTLHLLGQTVKRPATRRPTTGAQP